jgi:hypothetical protein
MLYENPAQFRLIVASQNIGACEEAVGSGAGRPNV